jgi:hypothetical protein
MAVDEAPGRTPPVEERLAGRLAARGPRQPVVARTKAVAALAELGHIEVECAVDLGDVNGRPFAMLVAWVRRNCRQLVSV